MRNIHILMRLNKSSWHYWCLALPSGPGPVDVGEIGHLAGCHHPIEELHGLHGWNTLHPAEHRCGDEEARALEDHHRLVAQPVCQQEHRHQHSQVGVRPHGKNLIVYLIKSPAIYKYIGKSFWVLQEDFVMIRFLLLK